MRRLLWQVAGGAAGVVLGVLLAAALAGLGALGQQAGQLVRYARAPAVCGVNRGRVYVLPLSR